MSPLPATAVYDLTRPMAVAVSPDGTQVAIRAFEFDRERESRRSSVFLAPVDGSDPPRRIAGLEGARTVKWSPDGTRLGAIATRTTGTDAWADSNRHPDVGPDAGATDGTAPVDPADSETDRGTDVTTAPSDPAPQVWVTDVEGERGPRRVTAMDEGVSDFDWGPRGDRIVVAARDPTDEEAARLERRRAGGPIETERLQHRFEGVGWLDTVTTRLFVVDLEAASCRRLEAARGGGIGDYAQGLQPAWHPTADLIAFLAYHGPDPDDTYTRHVHLADVETGETTRLASGDHVAREPTWSPDGRRLALLASDPRNWYVPTDVYVLDVEPFVLDVDPGEEGPWTPTDPDQPTSPHSNIVHGPGGGPLDPVTADLDRTIAWFEALEWLDEASLLTAIGDEGWSRFVRLDADGGHERLYDRQSRTASLAHLDVAADTVAFVRQHPREGVEVFATDVDSLAAGSTGVDSLEAHSTGVDSLAAGSTGVDSLEAHSTDVDSPAADSDGARAPRRLTAFNDDLVADHEHPDVRRFRFEGADGDVVEAIAFLPPGFDPDAPTGEHPLLLSIHGGPRRYDEPRFDVELPYWTSRGYVVLNVNYHGSTSYGRDFCEALRGRWTEVEVRDLLAGTDAVVERGWVDPERLFVTGFSFGGRSTAAVLTATDRFVAGAAEHGNYDPRAAFGADDRHRWWENELGLPWEHPNAYEEASPLAAVEAIETPLLLTAGGEDRRDPVAQAERLYVSLKKRGVDAKLVVYPDTGHVHPFIAQPDRARHRLETIAAWFERFDPVTPPE